MTEPGQIRFSGVNARGFEGTFDTRTGRINNLTLVDLNALNIQGDFNQRDLQRLQTELRNTNGTDTTGTRERIAERTETTTVRPPDAYTNGGRYTEARTDADLREGFRGDRVRTEQQRLKDLGYDLGTSGADGNGVDGFWGPNTQRAYDQYLADTGRRNNGNTTNNGNSTVTTNGNSQQSDIDALRTDSANRTRYTTETPQRLATNLTDDLNRTNALGDPTPNTDGITRTVTGMNNETIRQTDAELQRNGGASMSDRFDAMDDGIFGINDPFAIRGDNSDYIDFMKRNAGANRMEGDNAAANSPVTDEYQRSLLRARTDPTWALVKGNGTDENSINHVFSRASGAQLAELDRRFRAGITDEDGERVQFDNGLRGYIESEIGEGAHRDALLAQLNRPLR
jgi:hypothetical protein